MLDQTFGRIFSTQWLVFAILLIVLLGLSEFAWRMGFAHRRQGREKDKHESSVPSAVLALLGLLLGFSFALAVSRNDARRDLVVREANSIGATARRAHLLPEPQAANVMRLLREYVPLRIEAHREAQFSERFASLRKRNAELHKRLWNEAVAAAARQQQRSPRVSSRASTKPSIWKQAALLPGATMYRAPSGCCCFA
jgi:hypothetical protein